MPRHSQKQVYHLPISSKKIGGRTRLSILDLEESCESHVHRLNIIAVSLLLQVFSFLELKWLMPFSFDLDQLESFWIGTKASGAAG